MKNSEKKFQSEFSVQAIDTLCPLVTFLNDNNIGTALNEFNFSSGWNYETVRVNENYEGDSHWTIQSGAKVTIKFVATEFIIIATKDPGHGIMTISIDGDNPIDIDLYSNARIGKQQVFQSPVLSNIEHIIEIKCSGRKNASATGIAAYIDGIFVLNKNAPLIQNEIPSFNKAKILPSNFQYKVSSQNIDTLCSLVTFLNDGKIGTSLNEFNFSSGWNYEKNKFDENYEGDSHWTNESGATVTIKFVGTEFIIIANKDPGYGIMTVSIDGDNPIDIDLYYNFHIGRQQVFQSPVLSNIEHLIEIKCSGRKNTNATGIKAYIDGIFVLNKNLALNKRAIASAKEYDYLNPNNVTDGVIEVISRWGSGNFNTGQQWIYIDLEEKTEFDEIIINWAKAHATIYRIEISNDANSWTSIHRTTTGNGGKDVITFNFKQNARFVRIYGEKNNPDIWYTMAIYEIEIYNRDSFIDIRGANLALKKKAVASAKEYDYLNPNNVTDGVIEFTSRWGSGDFNTGQQWIYIDLEERTEFDEIIINWAKAHATIYRIEISNDANSWTSIYRTTTGNGGKDVITFNSKQNARFVRVYGEKNNPDIWYTMAIYEIEIYNKNSFIDIRGANLALNKKAVASAKEYDYLDPNNITDGVIEFESRWGSGNFNTGQQWIYIDLEERTEFDEIIINWATAYATVYRIEISNDANSWTSIYRTITGNGGKDVITFNFKQNARFVRVYGEKNNPDIWHTMAIYEIEIYNREFSKITSEVLSMDVNTVIEEIKELLVNKGDTKLNLPLVPKGFTIKVESSDFISIIDRNANIYTPLVDTNVKVNIKVSDENGNYSSKDFQVVVPGMYNIMGSNKKPNVIPNLREWIGFDGSFVPENSKIVIDEEYNDELTIIANKFAKDYKVVTGNDISVVSGEPKVGDFYITLYCDDKGIGKEGYYIHISNYVRIEAISKSGAFFSTRTILQILQQNKNSLPKGIIRDYPKYEVRGFMLDVGRRFATLDYLKQYMEVMAWYKMNDFQIHLNDNYTWIDDTNWKTSYGAFRLECDTFPGLTAKDGHYTKSEFKAFVKLAKEYGVNIIAEIDSPAHSLAFTQYKPELALQEGRKDYLDVENPNVYAFINSLFNEYLGGDDPILGYNEFHMGTDEYSGTTEQLEAFRGYTDLHLKTIRDEYGLVPRLWGSLSKIQGKTPVTSMGVTMNIWNNYWADAKSMIDEGYDIINSINTHLYIVPFAGNNKEYLNIENLFNNWNANNFDTYSIHSSHPKLRGAMVAFWNDIIGPKECGICEFDVYDRSLKAAQVIGEKLWAGDTERTYNEFISLTKATSTIPNTNLTYTVNSKTNTVLSYNFEDVNIESISDNSGNNYTGKAVNVIQTTGKVGKAIELNGSKSYVETPIDNIGPNYTVSIWINKKANGDFSEQILAESSISILKACQNNTGNVGFSREGIDYSFNYKLPENKWTKLTLVGSLLETKLYIDNTLVDTINVNSRKMSGTFVFPLARIGSFNNSFKGSIDEFIVHNVISI